MKILLLHLSDIHIKQASDMVLKRTKQIAAAAASVDGDLAHCVIVGTGDIAFSGLPEQYELANKFFDDLHAELRASFRPNVIPVDIIVLPGNHDCDFSTSQDIRKMILDALPKDPKSVDSPEVADLLTNPQDHFRNFLLSLRQKDVSPAPVAESRLCSSYLIDKTTHAIRINCVNTAWMSERRESPGKIVLPPSAVPARPADTASLVITAFHHPYQWLLPENARAFREAVEANSDLVLTGHEHTGTHRRVASRTGEDFTHAEAPVLQDSHVPHHSAFNVFVLDIDSRRQRFIEFKFNGDCYEPDNLSIQSSSPWMDLPLNKLRTRGAFGFSSKHDEFLDEPGLNLHQRQKRDIRLRDFYVFPDMREVSFNADTVGGMIRGDNVITLVANMPLLLITGDNYAGKSALAKMLCRMFHSRGDVPLLFRVQSPLSRGRKLRGKLDELIGEQYRTELISKFRQLDIERRVLVLDDFDRAAQSAASRSELLRELQTQFGRIVLLANELTIDVGDIVDPLTISLPHYEIQPFGYRHRNDFVEKWIGIRPESDPVQLARRVTEVTRTLNQVVGSGLVPAYPVFVLAVLQACEDSIPVDTSISTHGYYYELLIRAELLRGSSAKDYDVLTGYLAYVAFRMFQEGGDWVTQTQYRSFHDDYVRNYDVKLSRERILRELCERRMLSEMNDIVRFRYEYVFYYFVASYLRDRINENEVRVLIEDLIKNTHRRQSADILLFLAHLSKDKFIIDTLLRYANEHYAEVPKVSALEDVSMPGDLPDTIMRVAYEERDVRDTRRELAAVRDDNDLPSNDRNKMEDEMAEAYEPVRRLLSALRSLQIVGQILKNYPGHLEAETKMRLATAGYGIGARAWRAVFDDVMADKEELARAVVKALHVNDPSAGIGVLNERAQKFIHGLIYLVGLGVVKRLADALGAPELDATYDKLVKAESGHAVRIVRAAIGLEHDPVTPEGELTKLYREIKGSPLAAWIVRQLVVEHFHSFPVSAKTKQRLCAHLEIHYKSGLESRSDRKMLPPKKN